jgi:hypothetical protein
MRRKELSGARRADIPFIVSIFSNEDSGRIKKESMRASTFLLHKILFSALESFNMARANAESPD